MAPDIKKYISAASLPIIALTAVAIIYNLVVWTPPYNSILSIVQVIIVCWAGYRATKENGIGLIGSAVVGFFTGAIANFVEVVVVASIGIARNGFGPSGVLFSLFVIMGTFLFGTIMMALLWIAFGVTGGFVGRLMSGGNVKVPPPVVKN